jgi:hypothetical protein
MGSVTVVHKLAGKKDRLAMKVDPLIVTTFSHQNSIARSGAIDPSLNGGRIARDMDDPCLRPSKREENKENARNDSQVAHKTSRAQSQAK